MGTEKWIADLIVIANAEREVGHLTSITEWLTFIERTYDDEFDFNANKAIFHVTKTDKELALMIVNTTLTFKVQSDHLLAVYANDRLIGKIDCAAKLFLYNKTGRKSKKCSRQQLMKIAEDVFKPIVDLVHDKEYRFYEY